MTRKNQTKKILEKQTDVKTLTDKERKENTTTKLILLIDFTMTERGTEDMIVTAKLREKEHPNDLTKGLDLS